MDKLTDEALDRIGKMSKEQFAKMFKVERAAGRTDDEVHIEKPELNSIWKNKKSGELYEVYDFTNEATERLEEYPVRISYRRLSDNTKWSRSLSDWHRSYDETDTTKRKCLYRASSGSCLVESSSCSFPKCEEVTK